MKQQMAIRFEEAMVARVAALAEREQRTAAAMVRILVGEALEAREAAAAGGQRGRR